MLHPCNFYHTSGSGSVNGVSLNSDLKPSEVLLVCGFGSWGLVWVVLCCFLLLVVESGAEKGEGRREKREQKSLGARHCGQVWPLSGGGVVGK